MGYTLANEVPAMACDICHSPNQRAFPTEINIHFPGIRGLDKPTVFVFPLLLVCLDCGLAVFTIDKSDLRALAEGNSRAQSKGIAA